MSKIDSVLAIPSKMLREAFKICNLENEVVESSYTVDVSGF